VPGERLDVLILLDTYYAGRGGSHVSGSMSGMRGVNEVIAATNEDSLAPGVSRLSFTSVLTRVLEDFVERHRRENIQWTAVALASHLRSYYYP
jgi:hypothetical protein